MEVGKYYLFACPWDYTFVGRFSRIWCGEIIIDHCFYFTKTGMTFGDLCRAGIKKAKSEISVCGDGVIIGDPSQIKKFPWQAPTDWPNPDEKGK